MTPHITGLDHALVGVADLDAAHAIWTRLGFTLTPRGRHFGWGTANYCIMFERDYLELLGILDPTQFVNGLDRLLAEQGEGLLGVAFAGEADTVHADLSGQGLVEQPKELSRLLELPEGDVTPRFRLAHFTQGALPGLHSAFVCQHGTPQLLRRPEWMIHANGAASLDGITLIVEDPSALATAYADVFGNSALWQGRGRLDVTVGQQQLRFLSFDRAARRYPGIAPPRRTPIGLVVTVLSADLDRTEQVLRERDIPTVEVPGVRLVVPPSETTGVILEFARH